MMGPEGFYFYCCFLIPRLFSQWDDRAVSGLKTTGWIVLAELVLLSPLFRADTAAALLGFLALYHLLLFLLERTAANLYPKRVAEFLFIAAAGGFLFGIFLKDAGFTGVAVRVWRWLAGHNVLLAGLDRNRLAAIIGYLFALLVVSGEMNNLIRFILGIIKTVPVIRGGTLRRRSKRTGWNGAAVDRQELNRGRIIGVIERILFFFFVITGNYASIAFILTAKGLTRFKELDDRNFAEYVLIGTLLSASLSIFWAHFIKAAVQAVP